MKYPSSDNRSSNSTGTPRNENATQKLVRENVDFLIEQLEAGRSDALTAYLTAMSHFHNYSFGNILQIARQKPDATHVAGMYAWNQLGHRVKKGEKGIRILAPIIGFKRKPQEEAEKDLTEQNVAVLVGFRNAYVFDISQTDGAELPETVAAKPKLVQITTAYSKPPEGSPILPRNQYVEIRQEKPQNKYQQAASEYKTCKSTTEAIITEGMEKGELRKICADPNCPVHHPKKQKPTADANWKAEQEKQRREEALAQATGLRVLNAITAAVPVRLMKRDLLFIVERVAPMLDERRLEVVARSRGIKKAKENDSTPKLLSAYIRKADEGELGRLLMEIVILHAARTQQNGGKVLKEAAEYYKVDTDAIAFKVKQEFAAKAKARTEKKAEAKPQNKVAKKSNAA